MRMSAIEGLKERFDHEKVNTKPGVEEGAGRKGFTVGGRRSVRKNVKGSS
jgi:hypothetical protein